MANLPTGGGRRDARERALHLLYECDQRELGAEANLAEQVLAHDDYPQAVLRGDEAARDGIDATILRLARGWTLERMPTMDRLILEIGIFELESRPDVPTAVVLNEAVELANQYSTDDSGRFVNGVLAKVAGEVRSDT